MENFVIEGQKGLPLTLDVTWSERTKAPIILFLHGFKGFKDWGHWHVIAREFADKGFHFVKMNFTHNGTEPDHLSDFTRLDLFGKNTFSKELEDVQTALDWMGSEEKIMARSNLDRVALMAHSRGGPIARITAIEDSRIKAIATWGSIGHLNRFTDEELKKWKSEGVIYVENSRTNQIMPLNYTLAEDFLSNRERLDIQYYGKKLKKPYLIVHGSEDDTISLQEAKSMKDMVNHTEFYVIQNGDHGFGGVHPWTATELPEITHELIEVTAHFLSDHLT